MELGLIRKVNIDSEMQQSYLDYAMSVIVSRALPDARDGLKPVQRRILYAMYDMGLRLDSSYKKSARIVGEVLGKYHPHGDMAVYEAMARMAQDFSMRYTLVDGQGNFGSVDGDPPAAMRYTEARLAPPAMHMLSQIDKNTVNFNPNFDDTLQEPEVLPAAIPNLLVNGATGIAVGMATNIPPHNLGEIVDALTYMLERWDKLDDIPIEDLMKFVKGPDFPTGGVILQDPLGEGLPGAYATGRGKVIVQARAHLEDMGRGRSRIIVTELPYMANKANLIERIADLVRDGQLEGVADLRDESDRHGMRIVIELSKTAEPEKILRALYHRTPMQSTFGIALLALVDGEPHWLSLKQALKVYVEHRLVVIRRRSEYDLEKARARAHVLEGLRIAIQYLDEIIQIIRNSPDVEQARKRLMSRYKLSDIQATAILDMPLRRLAALERKKIEQEYKELIEEIKGLEALLHSPQKIRQVVVGELQEVKRLYADRRRTQIVKLKEGESITSMLTTTDVTPAENVWLGVSRDGRICRSHGETPLDSTGQDAPRWLLQTSTHHTLYLVAKSGRAAAVPVHAIPEGIRLSDGAMFQKVSPLNEDEEFATCFALPPHLPADTEEFLLTVSRNGMVKKSLLTELPGPSSQPFLLTRVNDGDSLLAAAHTTGKAEVMIFTQLGMAIRFSEAEVRPMGLNAAGVGAIKLAAGDEVVNILLGDPTREIFLLAADGKGKRVPLKEFPTQSRYGQGVITWKLPRGVQIVSVLSGNAPDEAVLHFEREDPILIHLGDAPLVTRANQGRPVTEVDTGDRLLGAVLSGSAEAPVGKAKSSKGPASPPKTGTGRQNGPAAKGAKAKKTGSSPAAKTSVRAAKAPGKVTQTKGEPAPASGKAKSAPKPIAAPLRKTTAPPQPVAKPKTTPLPKTSAASKPVETPAKNKPVAKPKASDQTSKVKPKAKPVQAQLPLLGEAEIHPKPKKPGQGKK